MHRALGSLLIGSVALGSVACARPSRPASEPPASACDAATTVGDARLDALPEPEWGARVVALELDGARHVPEAALRSAIGTRVGSALDQAQVAADVRALHALETFEQVAAETEATAAGVRLRFVVTERPLVGRVEHRGVRTLPPGRYLPLASGELHDPVRVQRAQQGLEDHLVESGHLDARVTNRQRRRGARVDLCFVVEPGPRYLIAELAPVGNALVPNRELLALVDDHDGKANRAGAPFRPDLLEPDRLRLLGLYYDRGFLNAEVGEPRVVRYEAKKTLRVEWPIHEGSVYRLSRLGFSGRLRAPERRYRELLGLEPGQVLARSALSAGLERIREHHRKLGRDAEVIPETELDAAAHTVSLRVRIEEPTR